MTHCQCCGAPIAPTLSREEYEVRAIPRLAALERLAERIDFSLSWELTPDGERYKRLMDEQMADEQAAGL